MTRALPEPIAARAQLGVALSPYHLATGEVPALAALQLADLIVTLLPVPPGDEDRVRAHAHRSPAYAAFMESWSWSAPLWEEGIIGARLHDEDAGADLREVLAELESHDGYSELRPFLGTAAGVSDPGLWLDAIARDVVRGGPNPGWSIPLTAAVDRFAARHALAAARSAPTSIAQRAEERLSTRVFALAVPVLAQAPGERLIEARERLAPQLRALRARMSELFAGAFEGETPTPDELGSLRLAADAYSRAFDAMRDDLTRTPDDESDPRVLAALVSVTGVILPSDAAIRSSLTALRAAKGQRRKPRATEALARERTASLIIRRIGR